MAIASTIGIGNNEEILASTYPRSFMAGQPSSSLASSSSTRVQDMNINIAQGGHKFGESNSPYMSFTGPETSVAISSFLNRDISNNGHAGISQREKGVDDTRSGQWVLRPP